MRLSVIHHLVLATGIFTLILIVGILAVSHIAVIKGIEDTERETAPYTAEKILAVLSMEEENLARLAYDWSVWDDTYDFVQTLDEQYIRSNLVISTFVGIEVNDILFFDTDGKLRYGVSSDYRNKTIRPVPGELIDYYYNFQLNKSETPVSGIVPLESGPVLVAVHPIVRSDETGDPRGAILIGRDLDEARISSLSNYTLYPFSLMMAEPDGNYSPIYTPLPHEDMGMTKSGTGSVITSATLNDISGNPSFIARMVIPYYSPYTSEVLGVMIALVITLTGFFFIVIFFYYQYFFVRYIRNLSEMLDKAVHTGPPSDLSCIPGPPEITRLAASAKRAVRSLQENRDDLHLSRENLEEAEERWQILFEEAADPMCVGDEEGILNANCSWVRLFGSERSELVNLPLSCLSLPLLSDGTDPMALLKNRYYSVSDDGSIRFDWRVPDSEGRDVFFDVTIKLIRFRGKQLRFVVARDISVQVQMQEEQAVALSRIDENLVQLGTLNDEIRNPLTIIMGLIEDDPCIHAETIQHQVKKIDTIIDRLDRGYLDSEKVRHYLKRSFELGRR